MEKRVAVTLYRLACNECYRTLSNLFAVGKSTASQIVNKVCQVIAMQLSPQLIKMPSGTYLERDIATSRLQDMDFLK